MTDHISYWKCEKCQGTGRCFPHWASAPWTCEACDGTGNAMIDGDRRRHERKLAEFDRNSRADSQPRTP